MERKEIWKALLKYIKHTFISRTNNPYSYMHSQGEKSM